MLSFTTADLSWNSQMMDQTQFDISFKFQTMSGKLISNILSLTMAEDVVAAIGLIEHASHTIPYDTIPFHTYHMIPFHTIQFHTIPRVKCPGRVPIKAE